jgi:hypothetical protein
MTYNLFIVSYFLI